MQSKDEELTPLQEEFLRWLDFFIALKGMSPTFKEMLAGLRVKSPAQMQQRVNILERKGYVERKEGVGSRIIKLVRTYNGEPPILGIPLLGELPCQILESVTEERIFPEFREGSKWKGIELFAVRSKLSIPDLKIVQGDIVVCQGGIPKVDTLAVVRSNGNLYLRSIEKKGRVFTSPPINEYPAIKVLHKRAIAGYCLSLFRVVS